jgi:membrane-associated phospholipid phosphatase
LLLTLFLFMMITDEVVLEHETGFDERVFKQMAGSTSSFLTRIMLFFTFFGSTYFQFPAYILLIAFYLFIKRETRISINIAAIGLSSFILLFSLKGIFKRARPLDPLIQKVKHFSFPSGHSFSGFIFFGIIIYIIWQTKLKKSWKWMLSITAFFFASMIALSRVYLHLHFITDVIAGFCLSVIWLSLSFLIFKMIDRKQQKLI